MTFIEVKDNRMVPISPELRNVSSGVVSNVGNNIQNSLILDGTDLTAQYRDYGLDAFFGDNAVTPDNYPADPGLQPAEHDWGGVTDIDFLRFDSSCAKRDNAQAARSFPVTKNLVDTRFPSPILKPRRYDEHLGP